MVRHLAISVVVVGLLLGLASPTQATKCGTSTETHTVSAPKGCDFDKKDTCMVDSKNAGVTIKFTSGDIATVEFNLGNMDTTSPGSKTSWVATQMPGDKSAWPPKGLDMCDDSPGAGTKLRGCIDKTKFNCGYKFMLCVKPENNPWKPANTGCCITITIPPLPGSVCQDPHFTAFSGEKFDFMGEDDKAFNILSSPSFQLNALFSPAKVVAGQTFMTQMGIMTDKGDRIQIRSSDYGRLAVKLTGGHIMGLPADSIVSLDSGLVLTMVPSGMGNGETLTITSPDLRVRVYSPAWDQDGAGADGVIAVHLNLAVEVLNEGIQMHGVLGQTYAVSNTTASSVTDDINYDAANDVNSNEGSGYADYHTRIVGSTDDYLVTDLFSCDSKYCLFGQADALPLTLPKAQAEESDSAFPESSADVASLEAATASSRRMLQDGLDYTTDSTVVYADASFDASTPERRRLQDDLTYTTDSTVVYADAAPADTTPERRRLQDGQDVDYTTESTVVYADSASTTERRRLQDGQDVEYTTDSTVVYADDASTPDRRRLQDGQDTEYTTQSTVVYADPVDLSTSDVEPATTSQQNRRMLH